MKVFAYLAILSSSTLAMPLSNTSSYPSMVMIFNLF